MKGGSCMYIHLYYRSVISSKFVSVSLNFCVIYLIFHVISIIPSFSFQNEKNYLKSDRVFFILTRDIPEEMCEVIIETNLEKKCTDVEKTELV